MTLSPIIASGQLAAGHKRPQEESSKIAGAATQFEALLIEQMLRSARSPDGTASLDGESDASSSTLVDMSEQQFAQALANSGGLGIGKMIVSGLESHANR